jgi:hypothetical protein
MAAVFPAGTGVVLSGEAHVGFVDQGGGLEGVAAAFASHLSAGHATEFVVEQADELGDGLGVALSGAVEEICNG